MANSKNTNGRNGTHHDTGTVHIRLPLKIIAMLRRQSKEAGLLTMSSHAGMLLQRSIKEHEKIHQRLRNNQ